MLRLLSEWSFTCSTTRWSSVPAFKCLPKVSESLVLDHGDFLIRDSESSQGDFVLTSHWDQDTNHFPIRRTAVQPSETSTGVQYSLDQEAFDSVPALVHFYMDSREVLTRQSAAQIHRPVNRPVTSSCLGGLNTEERVCPRRSADCVDVTSDRENVEQTD